MRRIASTSASSEWCPTNARPTQHAISWSRLPAGQIPRNNWRHGSYRCVSGICGNPVNYGAWDTFEPQFGLTTCWTRAWRGVLHATSTAYNGIANQTAVDTSVSSTTVAQLGGPERFQNITDGTSNTLNGWRAAPLSTLLAAAHSGLMATPHIMNHQYASRAAS